ncbi:MAG: protein kinase, partial [Acidobacteria bacterium]|nr:protein kinase [Acidobacteriota bacterium]
GSTPAGAVLGGAADDTTRIATPATTMPPAPGPGEPSDVGQHSLPVGTQLGEFELTKVLGEGGFGIVYLALDRSLGRRVAVKEYMPSSLAMRVAGGRVQVKSARHQETFEAGMASFINEARLLASFDHPSLVKVYRFWQANGTAYMVMPFYEGETLKDRLQAQPEPPDEDTLRRLLAPLTEALLVIHAEQCYHRDIAPDNVMLLAGSGRPLLLDFGAARRVIGDMTRALTVILKPGYAPVEQYAEIPGMKQGPWTDVYALAAVVYYAITGHTPPPSVARLVNDTYQPLAERAAGRYSAEFLSAIDRALSVRPDTRTQTIQQFRDELRLAEVVAAPAAPGARGTSSAGAETAASSGGRRVGIGLAVAAVAMAGVAFGAWRLMRPAPDTRAPSAAATPAAPSSTAPAVASPSAGAPAPAPVGPAPGSQTTAGAPGAGGASPPPAGQAAVGGLDGLRELERLVEGQSPDYAVQAQATKTTLRIGRDDIGFTVESARDGNLYVFAVDGEGTLAQVVPNTVSGSGRIRKGQRYRFPTGDGVVLETAEPAGAVYLVAMVSDRQRDLSALEPQVQGAMRLIPTGPKAAGVVARHAGPQPLLAGRVLCPPSGACDTSYGAAIVKVDVQR